MRVAELALEDFRSYERLRLDLAPGVTAFVGPNGKGKTNLLEAIHLLARGDSPRAREDSEMVRWGATLGRASAAVERADGSKRVETLLFAALAGERRRPRRYLVNGAGRRGQDALGEIIVVSFFPEDVELLTAAPAGRRRYLDAMIGQVDRAHRADVREYARVVEQRNALLRGAAARRGGDGAEEAMPAAETVFWDDALCRLAARISLRRERAVQELVPGFDEAAARFSLTAATALAYAGQVAGTTAEEREAGYQELVREKRERELWQGTTLVGPHREDLSVRGDGRPLAAFASRGEQRSAVLALKLAEAGWLRARTGDPPIFLLDDVLSELDPARRAALVDALPADAQALLTAALPAGLPPSVVADAMIVQVPLSP